MDPTDDGDSHEGGNYLVSVSDLMIGLLFVFLLMLTAFALQYREAEGEQRHQVVLQQQETRKVGMRLTAEVRRVQDELTEAEREREHLLEKLRGRLQQAGIPVHVDAASGVLHLENSVLFGTLSADLSDQPLPAEPDALAPTTVVERLAAALEDELPCYALGVPRPPSCSADSGPILEAVFVEGHTDNRPIPEGTPFAGNYQLSTARARTTYVALMTDEPSLKMLENRAGQKLFGLSGYGPDRPIAAGNTPEDWAKNRRIDLRFLLAAPPPESLDDLLRSLQRLATGHSS